MTQPQGLKPEAQQAGRDFAFELVRSAIQEASTKFPGDHAAQFAFLASMFAELRRICARGQNEGFRLDDR